MKWTLLNFFLLMFRAKWVTDVNTFKNSDLITNAIELNNSRLYSISSFEALKSICFYSFCLCKDGHVQEAEALCRSKQSYTLLCNHVEAKRKAGGREGKTKRYRDEKGKKCRSLRGTEWFSNGFMKDRKNWRWMFIGWENQEGKVLWSSSTATAEVPLSKALNPPTAPAEPTSGRSHTCWTSPQHETVHLHKKNAGWCRKTMFVQ